MESSYEAGSCIFHVQQMRSAGMGQQTRQIGANARDIDR